MIRSCWFGSHLVSVFYNCGQAFTPSEWRGLTLNHSRLSGCQSGRGRGVSIPAHKLISSGCVGSRWRWTCWLTIRREFKRVRLEYVTNIYKLIFNNWYLPIFTFSILHLHEFKHKENWSIVLCQIHRLPKNNTLW